MPQNFLLPAQSDMEGSVTWSGVSASPTLTNSTDFASTGTKSLKEVTTTTGTFKVALTTGRACTAKALTTFKMDVRSSVSKFIDWESTGTLQSADHIFRPMCSQERTHRQPNSIHSHTTVHHPTVLKRSSCGINITVQQ